MADRDTPRRVKVLVIVGPDDQVEAFQAFTPANKTPDVLVSVALSERVDMETAKQLVGKARDKLVRTLEGK